MSSDNFSFSNFSAISIERDATCFLISETAAFFSFLIASLALSIIFWASALASSLAWETIEFLRSEFLNKDKLLGSAYDADSEGEEGKYYVFEYEEIKNIDKKKNAIVLITFDKNIILNKLKNFKNKWFKRRLKSFTFT